MEKLFNNTDIKFIFLFSIKDLFRSKAKLLSISITLFLSLFIYSTILTINLANLAFALGSIIGLLGLQKLLANKVYAYSRWNN